MTPHSLHTLGSSLQVVPVAIVYTTQLLLTQKSMVTAKSTSDGECVESHTVRATKLTAILKGIPGYNHGGLND